MSLKQPINLIYLLFFMIVSTSVFAETELKWETIFYSDTHFQYTTSSAGVPDTNWRNPGFNADAWNTGKGGIGYADNDDNTIIDNTIALFFTEKLFYS